MEGVAAEAEQRQHHPDWSNSWNVVTVELRSHDADAVTDRDLELARAIDAVLAPSDRLPQRSGMPGGRLGVWMPPSTSMILPVTKAPAGLASHRQASPMSSTSPMRRSGVGVLHLGAQLVVGEDDLERRGGDRPARRWR